MEITLSRHFKDTLIYGSLPEDARQLMDEYIVACAYLCWPEEYRDHEWHLIFFYDGHITVGEIGTLCDAFAKLDYPPELENICFLNRYENAECGSFTRTLMDYFLKAYPQHHEY